MNKGAPSDMIKPPPKPGQGKNNPDVKLNV